MDLNNMPKWMYGIPGGIGAVLAIAGMYLLPLVGVPKVLGPMIGLPVGFGIGFLIVFVILKRS